jgi:drug/metabolite transporter (DMT)-like permease
MTPDLLAAAWGGAAALAWGIGDFSGGLAARRATTLAVTLVSNPIGLLLLALIAVFTNAPVPSSRDALLAIAVGASGAAGIFLFYEALKRGQMGIAAPISAVLANVITVVVGAITEGTPGIPKFLGFALACAGVVLISQAPGGSRGSARSLQFAALSGLAFGVFFSLGAQFSSNTNLGWTLVLVRLTSCLIFYAAAALQGTVTSSLRLASSPAGRALLGLGALAGIGDSLGNLFYALAGQAGRLDISAVTSGLYPVATVALALIVLRERFTRIQGAGAVLALVALVLIVAG